LTRTTAWPANAGASSADVDALAAANERPGADHLAVRGAEQHARQVREVGGVPGPPVALPERRRGEDQPPGLRERA
jgi:hypothetical protein